MAEPQWRRWFLSQASSDIGEEGTMKEKDDDKITALRNLAIANLVGLCSSVKVYAPPSSYWSRCIDELSIAKETHPSCTQMITALEGGMESIIVFAALSQCFLPFYARLLLGQASAVLAKDLIHLVVSGEAHTRALASMYELFTEYLGMVRTFFPDALQVIFEQAMLHGARDAIEEEAFKKALEDRGSVDPLSKEHHDDPVAELLCTVIALGSDDSESITADGAQARLESAALEQIPLCLRSKPHNLEELERRCDRLRKVLWTQLHDYLEIQREVEAKGQMINDLVKLRAAPHSPRSGSASPAKKVWR